MGAEGVRITRGFMRGESARLFVDLSSHSSSLSELETYGLLFFSLLLFSSPLRLPLSMLNRKKEEKNKVNIEVTYKNLTVNK